MKLGEMQRLFAASVSGSQRLQGVDERGMRVYANNYRGQLIAALGDTYAKTRLWLGDEAFDTEAGHYVDANAPSSWTLDAYGRAFPDMLEARYPDDPDVHELAWIDRALREAFSGPDAVAIEVGALVAEDWERVEFAFVPTLRFHSARSNAAAIWKALAEQIMPPGAEQTDAGGGVRIWRKGLSPQFASMDPDECACLDLALTGATFGEICELLSRRKGPLPAASEAGILLRTWVGDGLVQCLRG
jgi:hypothetical protein